MNIDGLKGLLIAGTLLFAAVPQASEAASDSTKSVQLCEGKAHKKAEAKDCENKAEGCGKAEGECCKSPKVSQKPDDDSSSAGGGGDGDGSDTTSGATGGTTTGAATGGADAAEAAAESAKGNADSSDDNDPPATPAGEPETN